MQAESNGDTDPSDFDATTIIDDTLNEIITNIEDSSEDSNDENNANNEPNENEDEESEVEDNDNAAPNNDFCFTTDDFLPVSGSPEFLFHQGKLSQARAHIESLNGKVVTEGKGEEAIEWRVVPGVFQDDMKEIIEAEEEAFENQELEYVSEDRSLTKLDLFLTMWPGNFWEDFEEVNNVVKKMNIERKKKFQKVYREVSKKEFLTFHALFILASQVSRSGTQLWTKSTGSFINNVDFTPYMKEWRFKEMKVFLPHIMHAEEEKEFNDWWRFSKKVHEYNESRKQIRRCSINVLDESMSAFVPR